jgi:SAM-dependent methyltransferase
MSYNVNQYWEEVAQRIKSREFGNVIAGDDEPYYEYKRELSLNILKSFDIQNKTIFELGFGAGGNLIEFIKMNPKKIYGADVSKTMYDLSSEITKNIPNIELHLIKDELLPFGNSFFDIVFTITVLQHNTNEASLIKIIDELCRVSNDKIIISERVEKTIKGDELCLGRPVEYYSNLFTKNGFQLLEVKYLNLQASYYVCGAIRKLFNPKSRKEGEPLTKFSIILENILLPITRLVDKILPSNRDLAYLIYQKK